MKKSLFLSLVYAIVLTFTATSFSQLIEVQSTQQFNDLIKKGNVVIDFYAPFNCGPCNALAPVMHALAQEYQEVTFLKINGGKFNNIMSQYNVSAYPTLVFLKNGVRVELVRGGKTKSMIKAIIDRLFPA